MHDKNLTQAACLYSDGTLFGTKHASAIVPAPVSACAPVCDTHTHMHCLSAITPASALARAAFAHVGMIVNPIDPVEDAALGFTSAEAISSWIERSCDDAREIVASVQAGLHMPAQKPAADVRTSSCEPYRAPYADMLFSHVFAMVGVHPYNAVSLSPCIKQTIEAMCASPHVVGIGEIGIDEGPYNTCPLREQVHALRWQLACAREYNLPVELHIRDNVNDTGAHAHMCALDVIDEIGIPQAGCILHCFTSTYDVMQPFVERGCTIAFGGVSTFASAGYVRDALRACPPCQMVVETDAPYMAPVPLRGEECEPAYVVFTAAALADVRKTPALPAESVYRALWKNSCHLFIPHDETVRASYTE